MRDYSYIDMFNDTSVTKDYVITDGVVSVVNNQIVVTGGTFDIRNTAIESEQVWLSDNLFSGKDIAWGACEAAEFGFVFHSSMPSLANKIINVYMYLDSNPQTLLMIGVYKVYSDDKEAESDRRTVCAYDFMYGILNKDVAGWYNSILPNENSSVTVKQMRESLFQYMGIAYQNADLINDNMPVYRTIKPESMFGDVPLRAICQLSGRFGHFVNGVFTFVKLLPYSINAFPSQYRYPNSLLFPSMTFDRIISRSDYVPPIMRATYTVKKVTGVAIRQSDEDVGVTVGAEGNLFNMVGNFLLYGKSASELTTIGNNLLSEIKDVEYIPFEVDTYGNPCVEVGDPMYVSTDDAGNGFGTYVFRRSLRGIQALRDEYSSEGSEYRDNVDNSLNSRLIQMNGKYMSLDKSVDGLKVVIGDQNAGLVHDLIITAGELASEITRATAAEGSLSTRINQTSEAITLEAQRATAAEGNLSGRIDVQAGQISAKVTRSEIVGDLDTQMGSGIEIGVDRIAFKSSGSITIDTENFKLDEDGNATFSGNIVGGSIRGASFFSEGVYQPDPSITTGGIPTSISIEGGVLHNEWTIDTGITGSIDMWPGQIFLSLNSHGSTQSTRVGYDSISSTAGSFDRMYLYHGGSYHLVDFILLSEYTGQEKVLCIRPF